MKFLNYADILSIKRLSKRCYIISFLNPRVKYFQNLAKQIIDCDLFYQNFSFFIQNFLQRVKTDISLSNWLFLNYFLDNLKSDLMISSCFCHLFHCPRSLFAKNDCYLCSRKFISTLITKPKNFNQLFNFTFGDRLLKEYQNISFKGLEPSLFFKSYDEMATIMSNRKRCLTTCVVSSPSKIARLFIEAFLRILINYCYKFVEILSESEELIFLEKYFDSVYNFLPDIIVKFDFKIFVKIFSENNYNSNIFKIINENFINYYSEKYAC